MRDFAVALAGGGARGAYQIGALDAITQMDINVVAVTGTSIGSINGAAFAQGDLDKAYELWRSITIERVIALSKEMSQNKKMFNIKSIFDFSKSVFVNKGIDVTPLKSMLTEIIDEERLNASKIDFGLTTVSITDRTPIEIFKSDIPTGKMVDYLLASSCFPGFKTVEIDGKQFIDGGVSNNLPVSMLIEKGYKDIIAIDISGPGLVKNVDPTGINIITVKSSEKTVGVFEFDRGKLDRSIKLGSLDAYKAFGRLNGRRYYFENSEYEILRSRYGRSIIAGLEYAAILLSVENARIYKANEFTDIVMERYKEASANYDGIKEDLKGANIAELLKNWRSEEKLKYGVILPFLADLSASAAEKGTVTNAMLRRLVNKEFLAASGMIYLNG